MQITELNCIRQVERRGPSREAPWPMPETMSLSEIAIVAGRLLANVLGWEMFDPSGEPSVSALALVDTTAIRGRHYAHVI